MEELGVLQSLDKRCLVSISKKYMRDSPGENTPTFYCLFPNKAIVF